jgi:hypothetical protein
MRGLSKGVQQFRFLIKNTKMSDYVSEESAARIWIRVLGGIDAPLPVGLFGKKLKREEKEDMKGENLESKRV